MAVSWDWGSQELSCSYFLLAMCVCAAQHNNWQLWNMERQLHRAGGSAAVRNNRVFIAQLSRSLRWLYRCILLWTQNQPLRDGLLQWLKGRQPKASSFQVLKWTPVSLSFYSCLELVRVTWGWWHVQYENIKCFLKRDMNNIFNEHIWNC